MTTTDQIKTAIKGSGNWREAVEALVNLKTEENEPFSSGEVAADIRTHRPDLAFRVTGLGEYVRDMFYGGSFGYPDGAGGRMPAYQVPRVTQGTGRTPAGQTVFVYCGDVNDGAAHTFEVDIPLPPGAALPASDGDGQAQALVSGPSTTALPAPAPDLKATVHADGRMQIPRSAFEAFISASGAAIRGGDPVHIACTDKDITVTLNAQTDSKPHDISKDRGRVRFMSHGTPFTGGNAYEIVVTGQNLTIDLSNPV